MNAAEPKRHIKKSFATGNRQTTTTDETAFQYSHHGCELIIFSILWTKGKISRLKKKEKNIRGRKLLLIMVRFYVNYLLHPIMSRYLHPIMSRFVHLFVQTLIISAAVDYETLQELRHCKLVPCIMN